MNIFFFPFAGGNKHAYRPITQQLQSSSNPILLELPGRGMRMKEPLLTQFDEMVNDLYAIVKTQLHAPYVFFGHSMGATLAFCVLRKIIENNQPKPKSLIVTGRGGPQHPTETSLHTQSTPALIESLRAFQGAPNEVLDNEEMMEFFLPILRADFEGIENYTYSPGASLDVPVVALYGSKEAISKEAMELWRKESNAQVIIREMQGGHFFIFDHVREIARLLESSGK